MTEHSQPVIRTTEPKVCEIHGQRIGASGCIYCAMDDATERDPTPWCSGGHMSEASCTCGEIDSHD